MDYRRVNSVTRKDAYPLPRIDTTLDTLAGSQWFSTLDLLSGYWQVEMEETVTGLNRHVHKLRHAHSFLCCVFGAIANSV